MVSHGCLPITTAAIVATLLATACSHRVQRVEREMVLPPFAQVHKVDTNQRFLMAAPIEDPDPVYPARAALRGVLQLCAAFVVTAEGGIADVAIDQQGDNCADPDDPATAPFETAVRAALQRWRYFGAAVCTFPDGGDPDSDPRCEGPDVRVDPVPIRLRYVFAFSSERGGRVSRTQASPVQ